MVKGNIPGHAPEGADNTPNHGLGRMDIAKTSTTIVPSGHTHFEGRRVSHYGLSVILDIRNRTKPPLKGTPSSEGSQPAPSAEAQGNQTAGIQSNIVEEGSFRPHEAPVDRATLSEALG